MFRYILFLLLSIESFSQNIVNDNTFNLQSTDGASSQIRTVAIQADNKILIGGQFNSYNGVNSRGITRLNTDGTVDVTFLSGTGIGFFGEVYSIVVQADGKILVGGNFFEYNGVNVDGVIRLLPNGLIDPSFKLFYNNTSPLTWVNKILLLSNQKIIVVGSFNTYQDEAHRSIVCLLPDGSIDASFNTGTGFATTAANIIPPVYTIAIDKNGSYILGGSFDSYDGHASKNIVRIFSDGSFDSSFNVGNGFDLSVHSIVVQSDNKYFVGGDFTTFNLSSKKFLIRLNENGSEDVNFLQGAGFNFNVSTLLLQEDGKLLVGGAFTSYNNNAVYSIVRLLNDGTYDISFNTGYGADSWVTSINIQQDGKLIVAGYFKYFGDKVRNRITRLINSTTTDRKESVNSIFNVYPLPIYKTFYVSTDLNFDYLKLFNLKGEPVAYFNSAMEYSINTLPTGVYMLFIYSKNDSLLKKEKVIIVQE